ncbi:glutathione S-transferase [Calocera viscosa TUFC12733]|uniref:Glutathione S-transferase n=1 Tax=Calocera viscosa (strain TUFC12733) TaxID=1330018 RepID=A0A167R0U7_CALVF|nr:glutathione S-transferase [Calocera viscosa TUFC12733]
MSKFLTLYTWTTPNGFKPSICLEELKAAYGTEHIDYKEYAVNIGKDIQKEPWFIKINPNGRIPALTDHKRGDFNVFESAAILLYLAQHYDPEHKFSFDPVADPDNYSESLQWIFFTHGGIGPMMGQAGHFSRAAPEKIEYAINRYVNESKRLYGVLEIRFQQDGGRDYLAGPGKGKYSIADINAFGWVKNYAFLGIDIADYPGIKGWIERIQSREAVVAGLLVPKKD